MVFESGLDSTSSLAGLVISLREGSGSCDDAAAHDFTASCPNWFSVTGTNSWSFNFDDGELIRGQTYAVSVKGTDLAGNAQTSYGSGNFSFTAAEGANIWNRDLTYDGASGDDRPLAGAVDSNGNLYVASYGKNLASGSTSEDVWIKKFSSSGTLSCEQKPDEGASNLADRATAIAVNISNSKIYITGCKTVSRPDRQMFVKRLRMFDCSIVLWSKIKVHGIKCLMMPVIRIKSQLW